jgi:hypothetical protein
MGLMQATLPDFITSGRPRVELLDAIRAAGGWLDRAVSSLDQSDQATSTRAVELAEFLYATWYAASLGDKPIGSLRVPLVEGLRAAHRGSWSWEQGWIADSISSAGRVIAARDSERRVLWPGDYISASLPGMMPPIGTALYIVTRQDSTSLLPGFWVTYSPSWFLEKDTFTRLYWNVQPAGAPDLVRHVTNLFEHAPYCLKVPSEPSGFARADAAVLYLPAHAFPGLRRSIGTVHAAVVRWLAPETPPLTKQLAPGLAAAETRWNAAESFGQQRCRLIAQALVEARARRRAPQDLVVAIDSQFLREGLNPLCPWLEPLQSDQYVL